MNLCLCAGAFVVPVPMVVPVHVCVYLCTPVCVSVWVLWVCVLWVPVAMPELTRVLPP